jgi:hypothetical protein
MDKRINHPIKGRGTFKFGKSLFIPFPRKIRLPIRNTSIYKFRRYSKKCDTNQRNGESLLLDLADEGGALGLQEGFDALHQHGRAQELVEQRLGLAVVGAHSFLCAKTPNI